MASTDWDEVLCAVASGESLLQACNAAGKSRRDFYRDLYADPQMMHSYARAREIQADGDADEARSIIAEVRAGDLDPAAARCALDGIKWSTGVRAARMFGPRVALTGAENAPAIKVEAGETVAKLATIIDRLAARGASEG